jgi:DNA modification methylase
MLAESKTIRGSVKKTSKTAPAISTQEITVYLNDNLRVLESLPAGSLNAIYIDPPFFTNRIQTIDSRRKDPNTPVYSDKWEGLDEYLKWMEVRLQEMKRVLSDKGLLFLHCDWHASHYLKVLMDRVFGYHNFKNEIIWQRSYTIGRIGDKSFKKLDTMSDSIFVYSKREGIILNKVYREHKIPFKGDRPPSGYYFDEREKRFFKTSPVGNYSQESIREFKRENRIHLTRNGTERLKYFVNTITQNGERFILENRELGNLWTDIPSMMHSRTEDKIAYPTQKPIKLIQRLLGLCVKPGDLVADFFHGSGSTLMAALRLNCKYLGTDINADAIAITQERLAQKCTLSVYGNRVKS